MNAASTLANVLDPRGTFIPFPSQLVRPWSVLYRRRRTRQRMYRGGIFLATAILIGPFILAARLFTVTYGTLLWAMWVFTVWSVWSAVAVLSYAGHVLWRTADLIGRDSDS